MNGPPERLSFTPADGVPPPVAPYSHATAWSDLVFVTGQLPAVPETGELVTGSVAQRMEQIRRNLTAVLAYSGSSLDDVLMARVFLADFSEYDAVNDIYASWFSGPPPSRTCVGVTALALGASIEIDLIARRTPN